MKRILVLSFSDLANDPRVSRQISLLAARFTVTAAGFAPPSAAGIEYIHFAPLRRSAAGQALAVAMLKLGRHEAFYWSSPTVQGALEALKGRRFDLIVANDLSALPLACKLGGRVLFDAHEYSPRELEDRFYWRFLFQRYNHYLCERYLPQVAGMLTVCQSIADEYRAHYPVSPRVLFSAPPYHELVPRPATPGEVRMVHHGGAIPSRKIERMIEAMDSLDDRFRLDLILVPGDPEYIRRLAALAAPRPRVRIVDPVPMRDLPTTLNRYDVGLFLLPPTNFNYRCALPNKFFEFVQARLAVAVGPSPEMAKLVRQHDCGVVADDFSARGFATQLATLDPPRLDHFKRRSDDAAKELCFEKTAPVMLDMIDQLLGSSDVRNRRAV